MKDEKKPEVKVEKLSIRQRVLALAKSIQDESTDIQDLSDGLSAAAQLLTYEANKQQEVANAHSARRLIDERIRLGAHDPKVYRDRLHKECGFDPVASPKSDSELIKILFQRKAL